jgi:plastocyanin
MLLVIAVFALASCMTTAGPTATNNVKVSIANFAFVPQEVTVAPVDSVTWSNDDGSPHKVAFKDGGNGSESLLSGETFTRVFEQPGNYEYFCAFHTYMTGRIIVRAP